jgi:hypothetical protein
MNAPTLTEPHEGFTCDDIPTRAVGHVTFGWWWIACPAAPHRADLAQCVTTDDIAAHRETLAQIAQEEAEEEDRRREAEAEAAEARHDARYGAAARRGGWGTC